MCPSHLLLLLYVQVSQLQLEMAHHRVQYQSDIAQVETTRRETEEQLQEKVLHELPNSPFPTLMMMSYELCDGVM